jgi:hypothetical protein
MLGTNFQHKSTTISNNFLVKECDLEDSSFEQFIDSGEEKLSGDGGMLILSDTVTQPTLESLLNNLTLDKPIIPTSCNMQISSSEYIATNRDPVIRRKNSISWLSTAFRYEDTSDDNLVIDIGSTETRPIILYASKMKLIEKITTVLGTTNNSQIINNNIAFYFILDYKLMDDFLLTVEMIIHPMDFATCLLSRLAQAFNAVPGWSPKEEIDPEVVKMRGLIVLQHWAGIIEPELDISIKKLVIDALDVIWQQSKTLSQSDQRFLIKIRRLFDPRGEISTTSPEEINDSDNEIGNSNEVSSVYDSETCKSDLSNSKRWREKLKLRFKSFFHHKRTNSKSFLSIAQSPSSFLINSFSSDVECEDANTVLMTERSRTLANILAILEWDLFSSIQRSELVCFPSARESLQKLSEECPNLQRSIEHFNSMCQWFVQLITNQDDDEGTLLLAKLIRLACKCILIHNYNTALQIILALQSPAVSSRKSLWISLPSWERRLSKDLAIFGSPIKNFKNVRKALEEVEKEEIPVIPFNGLFLSDLVFNWERESDQKTCPLIPFYKNHLTAKILKQFLAFKQPKHQFQKVLNSKEKQLYSYFADIGRLGGEFSM